MNRFLSGMICLLLAAPGCKGCSDDPAPGPDPRFVLPSVETLPEPAREKPASDAEIQPAEDPKEIAFSVAPD